MRKISYNGLWQFLISWVFNSSAALIDLLMVMVAAKRRSEYRGKLPDIGFDLFPERNGFWEKLPDVGVGILLVLTAIRAIVHHKRFEILRRWFVVGGIISLFRAISIVGTILPDPSSQCATYVIDPNDNIFVALLKKVADAARGLGPLDCGDVFFSGHSATLTTCAQIWMMYSTSKTMHIIVWLISLATGAAMLSVRFHYSVDIIFGFFVAFSIFNWYVGLAKRPDLRKYRIWAWFELEIEDLKGPTLTNRIYQRLTKIFPFLSNLKFGSWNNENQFLEQSLIDNQNAEDNLQE